MQARKACAHSGNAGQGLAPPRPQRHALLTPIGVGLRPEGLQARRSQPALMEHQNHHGFMKLYFSDTTLGSQVGGQPDLKQQNSRPIVEAIDLSANHVAFYPHPIPGMPGQPDAGQRHLSTVD